MNGWALIKNGITGAGDEGVVYNQVHSLGFHARGNPVSMHDSDDDTWQRLATLFRVHLNNVTKKTIPKEDLSRLSLSAQRYEGLGLDIPILSGCETQETRLRGGLWAARKAAIVRSMSTSTFTYWRSYSNMHSSWTETLRERI